MSSTGRAEQKRRSGFRSVKQSKRKRARPLQINRYAGASHSNLSSIPVVDSDELAGFEADPAAFYARFVATRTPVVFRQAAQARQLADKWTPAYLKQHAGAASIEVERRASLADGFGLTAPKVAVSFGDFVDMAVEQDDAMHYLTTQKIELSSDGGPRALCTAPVWQLRHDLPLPHPLFPTLVPHQLNLWMGNNHDADGTSSGLHHDAHDNLYIVLAGRKDFVLFSPADAQYMYTTGELSRVHRNGLVNYKGFATREDGADEFAVFCQQRKRAEQRQAELESQLEQCPPGSEQRAAVARLLRKCEADIDRLMSVQLERFPDEHSLSDSDSDSDSDGADEPSGQLPHFSLVGQYRKADPDKFPLLAKATPFTVQLDAGDMLYLPAAWFHDVVSRGRSCAVNYWFYPPANPDPERPYPDDFWSYRQSELVSKYLSSS